MSLKPLQITLARSAEPDPQAERFRESASGRMRRWMLGAAYACHPKRARDLPHLLALTAADMARGGTRVPDRDRTYPRPDTFAGVCRDFSPATVMAAARLGFFPGRISARSSGGRARTAWCCSSMSSTSASGCAAT